MRSSSDVAHQGIPDVTPEPASAGWRAALALLAMLPQASMSRAFGRLADVRIPRALRHSVLGTFARAVGIDIAEAELPLAEYTSLNDFFVRRLRDGVRPFPDDPRVLACPVDGVIGQLGVVCRGKALQAKGRPYSVARLLESEAEAERYEDGLFITLYLSPRHYHRIHSPCEGEIPLARHVPGALLPVNAPAVTHVQDLFPSNERLLSAIQGPLGRVTVVAIGAYNVGRISAAFDTAWSDGRRGAVTNRGTKAAEARHYDPPRAVRQGDEIMAFHLGSTVVLLVEPRRIARAPELEPGLEVRLGSSLGHAEEVDSSRSS